MERLTVGVCVYDSYKAVTVECLIGQIATLRVPTHFRQAKGSFIHGGREKLLDLAFESESSHLLFLDTDMVFPADTAQRLAANDKDIIGVAANQKSFPLTTTAQPLDPTPGDKLPSGLFECQSVGTGIMLIDLKALKDLPRPWFDLSSRAGHVVGEDVFFCEHARAHGFEVWCDPAVPVKHVGDFLF